MRREWRTKIISALIGLTIGLCVSIPLFILHPFGGQEEKFQITLPMERYTPLMSSVPGLPVEFTCSGSLQVMASAGSLQLYDEKGTARVTDKGKTVELGGSGKVYWSPATGDDSSVLIKNYKKGELVAKVTVSSGRHTAVIEILADEPLYYTAKIFDFGYKQ